MLFKRVNYSQELAMEYLKQDLVDLENEVLFHEELQETLNKNLAPMINLSNIIEDYHFTETEADELVPLYWMMERVSADLGLFRGLSLTSRTERFMYDLHLTLSGKPPLRVYLGRPDKDLYHPNYEQFLKSFLSSLESA